jgi:hypothetical protein
MKALLSVARLALAAGGALAQSPCPKADEVPAGAAMLGPVACGVRRRPAGTLLFEKHPEYPESFSGSINRDGDRRPVAGDIEAGGFTLEESADGRHIAATWLGDVVEGSCGREIRGTWKAEDESRGIRSCCASNERGRRRTGEGRNAEDPGSPLELQRGSRRWPR